MRDGGSGDARPAIDALNLVTHYGTLQRKGRSPYGLAKDA
jgi:hypothetical protein